jgi:hypothetical protein
MVISALLFFALQASPEPVVGDPPPPAANPVAVEVAPPPPAPEPPTTAVPAPPAPKPLPVADAPSGWDTLPTVAVQAGAGAGMCLVAGCAIGLIGLPLGLLAAAFPPIVLVTAPVLNGVAGALIAVSEVYVGDLLGKKRGAMLWPVVTGAGVLAVTGLTGAIVALVPLGTNAPPLLATGLQLGIAVVGVTLGIAAPIAVYQLLAEDKQAGDTGQGLPGLFEPARPMAVVAAPSTPQQQSTPPAAIAVPY